MTVGISTYDVSSADFVRLAVSAERAGFDSVWLGEHILLPVGYASEHPTTGVAADSPLGGRPIIDPTTRLIDPWVSLGAAAARTSAVDVGTAVFLAPLRHPLVTARAAITLHDLSGGRFVLGVGAGWLREEFEALGVPFGERGRVFDEVLAVLRTAWSGEPISYDGRYFRFDSVQLATSPLCIPIIVGGNSERAMRRALTLGDGWMGSGIPTFDEARELKARLERLRAAEGHEGSFAVWFRIPGADPDAPARYRDAGIDKVMLFTDALFPTRDLSHADEVLGEYGERAGLVRRSS